MTDPIRVLLVDDQSLVRSGFRMILGTRKDIVVVGEAKDGDQVLAAVDARVPDVVLMDVRMPRMDGIAATRELEEAPATLARTANDLQDAYVGTDRATRLKAIDVKALKA